MILTFLRSSEADNTDGVITLYGSELSQYMHVVRYDVVDVLR